MGEQYILGIDPGDSTGVAFLKWGDGKPELIKSETIHGGVVGFIEFVKQSSIEKLTDMVVVCEKFIVRPGYVGDAEALKIEGVLQFVRPDTVYQMPAMKRSLVPTSVTEASRFKQLRAWGYDGATDHELDAITHALLYLKGQTDEGVLSLYKKEANNG